jgi:hypothetical protein
LLIPLLTAEQWDMVGVKLGPGGGNWEMSEMKTIPSLNSGISKRQLAALRQQKANVEHWGQVDKQNVQDIVNPLTEDLLQQAH